MGRPAARLGPGTKVVPGVPIVVPIPTEGGGGGDGFPPKPPQQLLVAKGKPVHTRTLLWEQAACQTPSPTLRCNLGFWKPGDVI